VDSSRKAERELKKIRIKNIKKDIKPTPEI
jgi:hypothetical protein